VQLKDVLKLMRSMRFFESADTSHDCCSPLCELS